MCGIWALVNSQSTDGYELFSRLSHRGPDAHLFHRYADVSLGFHRLAIVDPRAISNQPFIYQEPNGHTLLFLCNGEIYNYRELFGNIGGQITSDCAAIPHLWHKARGNLNAFTHAMQSVRGEFAFLILEFSEHMRLLQIVAGRDEIGVRPLYVYEDRASLGFSSEIKGLPLGGSVREFPPGMIWSIPFHELSNGYRSPITAISFARLIPTIPSVEASDAYHLTRVRTAVLNSVRRRLSADRPIAFLLSGGIDSSLVAALGAKILGRPIRTFCCGMKGGTDLAYARKVADWIGSEHTEVLFTPEEGLAAIRDVARTVESWDITTIRASVGQYLVSKWIGTQTDARVVMVGEGPDEVCSSYLFNWYAPNGEALAQTAREYVQQIHCYDGKRADRCVARWGLEARIPLLDPEFIEAYWSIPGEDRMPKNRGMEKWWLRKAFEGDLLPEEVLWRKKEAFSDGVSAGTRSWFQIIQEWVEPLVSEEEMQNSPWPTPTKEAYYYRKLFEEFYGGYANVIPGFWQPKWKSVTASESGFVDPSARVLSVYNGPASPSLVYSNPSAMEQL